MNKIYKELYKNKVFTLDDGLKIIKNYQVLRNTLNRLTKNNSIKKLKGGLYYIVPLDNEEFYPDVIHIASKLRQDAIITAITALKVLNIAANNASDSTLYILSKHQSKKHLDKHTYKILKEPPKSQNLGIIKTEYETPYGKIELKVTDIERTIIECVKTRSIKATDLINLLKNKQPKIDIKKLYTYLEKYNINILYNKIGLILDVCAPYLKIEQSEIESYKKKLTKKIYYYKEPGIRLIRPRYEYYKDWNIMITAQLHDLIKSLKQINTINTMQ